MPIKTVNIIESLVDMASNIKEAHNNPSVSPALLSYHWSAFQTTDPGSVVSSHVFTSPQVTLLYRIGKHRITSNLLNTA